MPSKLSQEIANELAETAKKIATPGKGILAADESTATIGKRFEKIKLDNTEKHRAAYRELLFTTQNMSKYISGVILFEETLFQKAPKDGVPMVDLLTRQGVIPGIKVDCGVVTLAGTDDEKATQGLDNLADRCRKYYNQGARFAKWRAVLTINPAKNKPSALCISETAHTLARYASICQSEKLVPIVEPELLTDGSHSIEECADATERTLAAVFKALNDHNVLLEGCLLKPNMVTAGSSARQATYKDVAFYTIRTLKRTVPPALPGINFLSGGQSEEDASLNLNEMNKIGGFPWSLSFSYGRALQNSCLLAWQGRLDNAEPGKKAFFARAKANGEAQLGQYKSENVDRVAAKSLFEKAYVY